MSRQCEITGKKPMVGNNVSHANNRTKRRFLPNIQDASFFSEALKTNIRVKTTPSGIRTVEHNGGIDNFVLKRANSKLVSATLRDLRKKIIAKVGALPKPAPKKKYPSAKSLRKAKTA